MAKKFEFLFDVGAPNAYLVHKILPEFCAAHDADAVYQPVLLGKIFKATGNRAPMLRYADAPAKLAYEQLEFMRFIRKHHIDAFRMNPHFPVNSQLAMRVICAAQGSSDFAPIIDLMMRSMWEEGLDLAQPQIVEELLSENNLDGRHYIACTENDAIKARLIEQTEAAIARGVFGVPAFFACEELFWGKERLSQVAEALA
jgi:2-hydroxychromene-2-carboxylate isomerase